MLDFLAELGLKLTGWSTATQLLFWVCFGFALVGLGQWKRYPAKRVVIPAYISILTVAMLGLLVMTVSASNLPSYASRFAAAPTGGQKFVGRLQYASIAGLLLTLYFAAWHLAHGLRRRASREGPD
ncbi:MAG: hypothetical protein ACF8R7_10970 [Phycisphaerales bacterium JB039]